MAPRTPYTQLDYSGTATIQTMTTSGGISSSATTFNISSSSTWINTSGYYLGSGPTNVAGSAPFVVAIDYNTTSEEKVLCSGVTAGGVVTIITRGYEGTSAVGHNSTIINCVPVFSATEAKEANAAVANTVGQIAAAGDILVGTAANVMDNLAIGAQGTNLSTNGTTASWRPGFPYAMGAQGGILYTNGTTPGWTAAGTSGQLLTSAGTGTPVWATNTNVANVAKATLATTGLNISTASTPSSQAFDGVTNAANINWTSNFATSGAYTVRNGTASVHGGIVVTNAGYYQITGTIGCAIVTGTTAGVMTVSIAVDGTATGAITKFWNSDATTGSNIAVQVTDILSLTAGQVINLAACEPTANLTTNGNTVITIHQVA